ncbi:hypothetical protein A2532_00540 [Candidatus Wolfebacteria bacterium RIFOXYD2_FULL_48_11]|uniref:Uncharacterized protein n=1 Tax=Candidatus Wolfebacteria bacterium RIFOXYD1_FULL_48_65 TaxID=1802561 RepID=A0A1F8E3X8_9BACT|nr:MAG: hypothetical protein A2610_01985 [Candidatus Wolfebacteria bacterium RIFOXYD1_FULL_48_65]OGM96056.1 MAG: hypothetical protein A2532_00540 [Candidatus Wolfebacteria bacterium RIFOXYD2_FULL_48_11]
MIKKELTRLSEIRGAGMLLRKAYSSTSTKATGPHNEVVRRSRKFFKEGIVALPLMLLISGIVLEMTIAATLVVFYVLQSSAGTRNAADALVVARSGASDAAVQLTRNMGFDGTYTVALGTQRTAQITVCNQGRKMTACSEAGGCVYTNPSDAGKAEVTALGTVRGKNRCVRAAYAVDGDTGEIRLESSGEISL